MSYKLICVVDLLFYNVLPTIVLVVIIVFLLLGRNNKMGLTGRYKKIIGVLSTSMLYSLHGKLYAFYPSVSGRGWGVALIKGVVISF